MSNTETRTSLSRRNRAVRWTKRALGVIVGLAAVALLVFAFLPKPIPVELAEVRRGPLVVTVDEDGLARVKDRYLLSAPLSGNLTRITARPGDTVKQGDVLARIVPLDAPLMDARSRREAKARVAAAEAGKRQARAEIERAKVALSFAKTQASRARGLVSRGAVAPAELERAELDERARAAELTSAEFGAKVASYEAEMARAALSARDTSAKPEQFEVPSPVSGRVLKVMHVSEGVVQAGTPLLEVGDPKALEVVVDVLTRDAVRIRSGAKVSVTRWGGDPLAAHVRLIEPSAFTRLSALGVEEQRVNAIIDLDEPYPKWAALMDGFRVEARIVVWQSKETLVIPASALFRQDEGWAVFVFEGGRARRAVVVPGQNDGSTVEIASGLAPGQNVLVHPSDRVSDGARVARR